MRLLIAFDGSKDAEAAIDDLAACGLPRTGSAEVMSVAEVWLPPVDPENGDESSTASRYLEEVVRDARKRSERAVAEAEMLAEYGAKRTKVVLSGWTVTSLATSGSAGWEIVSEADRFDADLVLVGAQGHSFLSRVVLGSISQRVLTEARCSVRIGRGRIDIDPGPQRIIVGFDGSQGARSAIDSVAARRWDVGTTVRLVGVAEPTVPTELDRFVAPSVAALGDVDVYHRPWLERSAEAAVKTLVEGGLDAHFVMRSGNPKHVLIDEAEGWSADCIFLGANSTGGGLERFLIGSTSSAVAARAHCSVEVVRERGDGTGHRGE